MKKLLTIVVFVLMSNLCLGQSVHSFTKGCRNFYSFDFVDTTYIIVRSYSTPVKAREQIYYLQYDKKNTEILIVINNRYLRKKDEEGEEIYRYVINKYYEKP